MIDADKKGRLVCINASLLLIGSCSLAAVRRIISMGQHFYVCMRYFQRRVHFRLLDELVDNFLKSILENQPERHKYARVNNLIPDLRIGGVDIIGLSSAKTHSH